jgi:hypothetical protein
MTTNVVVHPHGLFRECNPSYFIADSSFRCHVAMSDVETTCSPSIDIEATVNLFPSNTRPTTIDIDDAAVIAVTVPFEGALAPLLQRIVKYYSPMSGKDFK